MDKLKNMSDHSRNGSWSGIFFSYFNMDIRLRIAKGGFSFFFTGGVEKFLGGVQVICNMPFLMLQEGHQMENQSVPGGEATF